MKSRIKCFKMRVILFLSKLSITSNSFFYHGVSLSHEFFLATLFSVYFSHAQWKPCSASKLRFIFFLVMYRVFRNILSFQQDVAQWWAIHSQVLAIQETTPAIWTANTKFQLQMVWP